MVKGWTSSPSPAPSEHSLPTPLKGEGEGGRGVGGEVIALIKPQFEAGRLQSAKGEGVIRDPAVHRRVLEDVLAFARSEGYAVRGLIRSPLLGPKGNVEFLAWVDLSGRDSVDPAATIEGVIITPSGNLERR